MDTLTTIFWTTLLQRDFPITTMNSNFRRMMISSSSNNNNNNNNNQQTTPNHNPEYELYTQYYFGNIGLQMDPISTTNLHDGSPYSNTTEGDDEEEDSMIELDGGRSRRGGAGDGYDEEIDERNILKIRPKKSTIWNWYRRHMNHSTASSSSNASSPREYSPRSPHANANNNNNTNNNKLLRRSFTVSMNNVFGFAGGTGGGGGGGSSGHKIQPEVPSLMNSIPLSSMSSNALDSPRSAAGYSPRLVLSRTNSNISMILDQHSNNNHHHHNAGDELDQPWQAAPTMKNTSTPHILRI